MTVRVTRPLVIDRGKQGRKSIEQLNRGEGELWAEVRNAIDQVVGEIGADLHGNVVVPVVVIYRKKNKRKRSRFLSRFGA
jgi:hypothetical protein